MRVSLRWEDPKTDANRRTRTKESENAKCWRDEAYAKPTRLYWGFLETREKTPCLQPISNPGSHSDRTSIISNISRLEYLLFESERQIRSPFSILDCFPQ